MRRLTSYILSLTIAVGLFTACAGSEASLQKYYIDNQDNENFLSVDIPASVIALKSDVDPEVEEAYKSLKKMNVLAFKKNGSNEAEYQVERKKVKQILKSNRYIELMRIKDKGVNFVIKYEGDEETESFDEVVVYASEKTKGFALVRVLGDDMTPEKFMKLANSVKDINEGDTSLKQLQEFLNFKSDIKID